MNTKTVIYTRTPFNTINAAIGVLSLGTLIVTLFGFSLHSLNDSVSPLFLEWFIVGLAGSVGFGALLGFVNVPEKMVKFAQYAVGVLCIAVLTHIYFIF